ncbi:MAG: citrate:proton symporter [Gemmatimonadaceae bacterium]|nr:citrate:proton symporter [Gemmatimonadaceae bacterium]
MLTLLAFSMVIAFMALIMTKRMAPLTALILVPIAFGLLGGFASELGPMMLTGVTKIAPTGIMLAFAILYFAIMIDAGLFEPIVTTLVRVVEGDPVRVVVGTAALALVVSLDGDGSTTYMITAAAMLPLYRRLGIRPLVLACVTMMAGGVMNILPWGGPTARAASALSLDASALFVPMIPSMLVAASWVLYAAYRLGLHERTRIAATGVVPFADDTALDDNTSLVDTRRPALLPVNAALTVTLMVALVLGVLPLPILFMIAFAIAIMINYPSVAEQKHLLATHAGNVMAVASLIFAAGIFTGILAGTKMVDAMAESVIQVIPTAFGPYLSIVTGILSIPFTFFISNDAFYFGILPILAKAGQAYGITAAEMGRASLIGQPVHLLSPLVPSTYLLVGLVGVDFDEHQRFTIKWALLTCLVLLGTGLLTTVIPFMGRLTPSALPQ